MRTLLPILGVALLVGLIALTGSAAAVPNAGAETTTLNDDDDVANHPLATLETDESNDEAVASGPEATSGYDDNREPPERCGQQYDRDSDEYQPYPDEPRVYNDTDGPAVYAVVPVGNESTGACAHSGARRNDDFGTLEVEAGAEVNAAGARTGAGADVTAGIPGQNPFYRASAGSRSSAFGTGVGAGADCFGFYTSPPPQCSA